MSETQPSESNLEVLAGQTIRCARRDGLTEQDGTPIDHVSCPACRGTYQVRKYPTLVKRCPADEHSEGYCGMEYADENWGIPCITSDCHGTGDLVTAGTGELWAVAVGLGQHGYAQVCAHLWKMNHYVGRKSWIFWYGELTEPERIELLAGAILATEGG